jgi:PAS domain S-box-containing protein
MVVDDLLTNWKEQAELLKQLCKAADVSVIQFENGTPQMICSTSIEKVLDLPNTLMEGFLNDPLSAVLSGDAQSRDQWVFVSIGAPHGGVWGGLLVRSFEVPYDQVVSTLATFQVIFRDQLKAQVKISEPILDETHRLLLGKKSISMLLDSMNGIPWSLNWEADEFVFIGKQIETALGYSPSDWPNLESWRKAVHKDDLERVVSFCDARIRAGEDHTYEYRIIKKDNSEVWVRNTSSVFYDEQKKTTFVFGFIIDITESKTKELELIRLNEQVQSEKKLFHNFIDSIKAFIFLKDVEGRLLIANKYYESFFDVNIKEFIGKRLVDYAPGSEGRRMMEIEQKVVEQKREITTEFSALNVRGEKKFFTTSYFPLLDDDGDVTAIGGSSFDVSERVTYEKDIERLNKRLEFAMHAGRIAYIEQELGSDQIGVSSYFEKLTGYLSKDVVFDANWLMSRIHPDDFKRIRPLFDDLINNKIEELSFDARILNASQKYIWLHYNGSFLPDTAAVGKGKMTGVVYDITGYKTLLEDLTRERNLSLGASQAKTSFLANMSHEIRTPLNAIIGFSDLLSKHIHEPKLVSYLNSIKWSGKMLLSLINDLLDVSKIEAGKLVLKTELIDVKSILEEIRATVALLAEEKGIELEIASPDVFPESIEMDALRLRQIVLNLVNNAVKFTEKGKVSMSYSFNHSHDMCGVLSISVADTGIGIAKEKQNSIFEPFTQEERISHKSHQGTGLGLAIINKLVHLMGGEILLNSEVGKGSIFTVLFPDVPMSEEILVQKEEENAVRRIFNQQMVLIAEHNEPNRMLLETYLSHMDLHCKLVLSGKEALAVLQEEVPDIILLDIRMPGMDGFETLKQIRQIKSLNMVPVIAIAASSLDVEINEIERVGFNGYISKPIDAIQLERELARHLGYVMEDEQATELAFENVQITLSEPELKKLRQNLSEKVKVIWLGLRTIQPSDKLTAFSQALKTVSEQYEWRELKQFQKSLEEAIESFDFATIQKQMDDFGRILRKLNIPVE